MKTVFLLFAAVLVTAGCVDRNPLQPIAAHPTINAAQSASPSSAAGEFQYLIATDFLCGLGATACPAISRASNGDMIEITGSGTLTTQPKSATGGGTFTHKTSGGTVLGSGTWTAVELLSFKRYGLSPLPSGTVLAGGFAVIRVHLSAGFDAILQVDCAIAAPPGHSPDGARLNIQDVINFNDVVSGLSVFVVD